MKKFIYKVIVAGIIVMLSGSFGAEAQNRRNPGTSSQQTTSKSSKSSSVQTKSSSSESRKTDSKAVSSTRPSNQPATRSNSRPSTQVRRVDPQVKRDAKAAERVVERDAKRVEHDRRAPAPRTVRPEPHYHSSFTHPYLEIDYRPAPFHVVGHHSFGYRIKTLPRGYEIRYVMSVPYYYFDGIYYRTYRDGGYVVVRPPRGSVIKANLLELALTAVVLNSIENTYDRIIAAQAAKDAKYYYGDGIYYQRRNGEYEVIDAPEGALISRLPEDFEEISLNGRTYYQVEDVLYKVVIVDGYPFFEVVARL